MPPAEEIVSDFPSSQLIPDPIPPKRRSVYPYYVSSSVPELHDKLYRDIFQAILKKGLFFNEEDTRTKMPFNFTPSREATRDLVDFRLGKERVDHATLLDIVEKVLEYSPHPSHPFKVDLSGAGLDPYGIVGDWIGTALSALVITYQLSPVFTLMEYEVERRVRELVNYPGGNGDGIITPGAADGNGYCIQAALQAKFPAVKMKGILGAGIPPPVLFVSQHGCPSVCAYCAWEGIGSNACVKIITDKNGRMDVNDLKTKVNEAVQRGQKPFMVVATAGTHFLGAIDPIDEIADVAQQHGMWLHVDAQLAGFTLFSKNHAHRLRGVERSDSFLWSIDKGLCAPVTMAILVTRASGIFNETFSYGAQYVFSPSSLYDNAKWDKGDNTLQCTRRPDVVKFWFMWKAKGQARLAKHVDHTYDLTRIMTEELRSRSHAFQTILPTFDSPQVAFYYIPRNLRRYSKSFREKVLKNSKFSREMRKNLGVHKVMLICIAALPGYENRTPFMVLTFRNSTLTPADIKYMLDQIEYQGEDEAMVQLIRKEIAKCSSLTQKLVQSTPFHGGGSKGAKRAKNPPEIPPPPKNYEDFVSSPIKKNHAKFMEEVTNVILQRMTYWEDERGRDGVPAQNFVLPEQLLKEFDFSLAASGGMESTGVGIMETEEGRTALMKIIDDINKYSVKFSHPFYNYNLSQGLDAYSLMADYVIAVVNSGTTFYEDNPMFCTMEVEVTKAVRDLVGYEGDGDGLVVAGGSAAIQISMSLACMAKSPDSKRLGHVSIKKSLVAFVSVAGHYATAKGSFYMGFGLENCVHVPTDESGRMSTVALRMLVKKAIDEGKCPFFCTATAGTTVLGVWDPLDEIADICQEFNMWLHVDGSYGGSTLTSATHRQKAEKFRGLQRSDSFNFNAHKVFGAVREASILVTRKKHVLRDLSLVPRSKDYAGIDLGKSYQGNWQDMDPECMQLMPDRRGNVFKLWFMWKAKGLEGLGEHVDYAYKLTEEVTAELLTRKEAFVLCNPGLTPQSPHVNFYFVPERLRGFDKKSKEFLEQINAVTYEIIRRITLDKRMVFAKKTLTPDQPTYLVMALTHSAISLEDAKYMLDVIQYYGQSL